MRRQVVHPACCRHVSVTTYAGNAHDHRNPKSGIPCNPDTVPHDIHARNTYRFPAHVIHIPLSCLASCTSNVLPERHDAVCHSVPLPATVLSQKNGSISGHSSSCPQTAVTDLASPPRKKAPLHTKKNKNSPEFPDTKSVPWHRYTRNLCSGQHSRPIPFFRQSNHFIHATDCPENRHPHQDRTKCACATLITRFSTVCVDKCDMTNGTALLCPANVPEKTETLPQDTVLYLFPVPYKQRPLPASPIICKNRFINVIIFPSLEIPA